MPLNFCLAVVITVKFVPKKTEKKTEKKLRTENFIIPMKEERGRNYIVKNFYFSVVFFSSVRGKKS